MRYHRILNTLFLAYILLCLASCAETSNKALAGQNASGIATSGWANVVDYGAVGGDTKDDYPAFESALEALPPGGGVIYVPAGVYKFHSGTLKLKKGVRLIGESKHSTYIINQGGNVPILVSTESGMGGGQEIAYIQFQTGNYSDIAVQAIGVNQINIHNNRFYSPQKDTGTHIQLDVNGISGAYNHSVHDNEIHYGHVGIELKGGITSTNVYNNYIIADNAIVITGNQGTGGNVYSNNLLQSCTGVTGMPVGNGIDLSSSTFGELITGNYIEHFENGILLRSGAGQNMIMGQHWDNNSKNIQDLNPQQNGGSVIDLVNNSIGLGFTGTGYGSLTHKGNPETVPLGLRTIDTRPGGNQWSILNGSNDIGQFGLRNDATGQYTWIALPNSQDMIVNGKLMIGGAQAGIISGIGSPEGRINAAVGSIYLRTDGSTNSTLYVKESGVTGSAGWIAK